MLCQKQKIDCQIHISCGENNRKLERFLKKDAVLFYSGYIQDNCFLIKIHRVKFSLEPTLISVCNQDFVASDNLHYR